jgi:hypothetical protein
MYIEFNRVLNVPAIFDGNTTDAVGFLPSAAPFDRPSLRRDSSGPGFDKLRSCGAFLFRC